MYSAFLVGPVIVVRFVVCTRVKSGKFGHQVNSDTHLQTMSPYEPSHQDFHCLLS